MVSKKGKRKLEYEGNTYYWFVRINSAGSTRVHILSENKKINLEYPPFDSEVPVTSAYIKRLLKKYCNCSAQVCAFTAQKPTQIQRSCKNTYRR